jgi:hypothetical protein
MDYTGKEYTDDDNEKLPKVHSTVAYLKLINVPTMFDIGCVESDPSSDFLTLNMIDDKTYRIER